MDRQTHLDPSLLLKTLRVDEEDHGSLRPTGLLNRPSPRLRNRNRLRRHQTQLLLISRFNINKLCSKLHRHNSHLCRSHHNRSPSLNSIIRPSILNLHLVTLRLNHHSHMPTSNHRPNHLNHRNSRSLIPSNLHRTKSKCNPKRNLKIKLKTGRTLQNAAADVLANPKHKAQITQYPVQNNQRSPLVLLNRQRQVVPVADHAKQTLLLSRHSKHSHQGRSSKFRGWLRAPTPTPMPMPMPMQMYMRMHL